MQNQKVHQIAGRVLLADRHQNMLEGIRSLLETVFDVVVMVADEKSLLDCLEKTAPDLVVVDLSLPVSAEEGITRKIRKEAPDMKTIILSIHDEQSVIDECMSAGAAGFVLKRSVVNDLVPAVWEVMKGRTYISPLINTEVN